MKKGRTIITICIISLCIFVSCGPTEVEIATMTAAAWTPTPPPTSTPEPTPTPTPIPYGLTIMLMDENQSPIASAEAIVTEVEGATGLKFTDQSGAATWANLPGENVTLVVHAQGYFSSESTQLIERGENQVEITLERDPFGVLPAEACAPGETLIYLEDFQDGVAQGWDDIELRANGWDIVSNPDEVGNLVASRPMEYDGGAGYGDQIFGDSVWRLKVLPTEALPFHLVWHWSDNYELEGNKVDWSSYQMFFDIPNIWIFRAQQPLSTVTLHETQLTLAIGVWHNFEISSFEGRFTIWVDGSELLSYDDPQPLPDGYFIIGAGFGNPMEPQAPIYYDDIVVCELSAPFMPMPTTEPAP